MLGVSYLSISGLSRVLIGLLVLFGWDTGTAQEIANALGLTIEQLLGIIGVIWGGVDTTANRFRKGPMVSVLQYRKQ